MTQPTPVSASGLFRKDTDEFGNTRLVKQANAKRTSLPLYLHPSRLDSVRSPLDARPSALWLGTTTKGSAPISR